MGEVVALRLTDERANTRAPTKQASKMPAQFDARDAERLLRWAMVNGLCAQELRYAIERVRDWAETRCNAPLKRDWPRVVMNAVQRGWALDGYQRFAQTTATGAINPRTGTRIVKRTPITEEYISAYLAWLASRGDA